MTENWTDSLSGELKTATQRLLAHMQQVTADPSKPLDDYAFRDLEYLLASRASRDSVESHLLPQLLGFLVSLQQDPTPVTRLVLVILKDEPFDKIVQYISPDAFIAALHSPSEAVNDVALTLLLKAAATFETAKIVISAKHLMLAIVRCWLYTNTIATAEKASQLLEAFLACPTQPAQTEAIWRNLLLEKDIYNLMFSYCSLKTDKIGGDVVDPQQKSLAQLRLLKALPIWAAVNFKAVSTSQHPDVEQSHGCPKEKSSLLDFAASHMIDSSDFGMHLYYITFCGDLLRKVDGRFFGKTKDVPEKYDYTEALDFLIDRGVHKRCLQLMLDPSALPDDDLARRVLPSETLNYFSVYADVHPDQFLTAKAFNQEGLFADQSLDFCQKLQDEFNIPHLVAPGIVQFLVSIPKLALLPRLSSDGSLVPTAAQTALFKLLNINGPYPSEKLVAIAALTCEPVYMEFAHKQTKGWSRDKNDGSKTRRFIKGSEAAAARALMAIIMKAQPGLYQELSRHAQNTAFLAEAQYSLTLFASLFKTEWDALPTSPEIVPAQGSVQQRIALPTETQLRVFLRDQAPLPLSGYLLALKSPVSQYTLAGVLAPVRPVSSIESQGKEYTAMAQARRNALLGLKEVFDKHSTEDLEDLGVRNVASIKSALRAQLSGRGSSVYTGAPKPEVATMGR